MKSLEEQLLLLQENITHTVYHASNVIEASDMLESNYFKLRHVSSSELPYNPVSVKKYPYYMSVARTVTSTFIKGAMNSSFRLIIEFDGEKLSQNFKGKAVDWYSGKDERVYGKHQDEAEDRLYSKYPNVSNIKKYIRAIHIASSAVKYKEEYFKKIQHMERNFPIYIYKSSSDMSTLQIKKAERV